MDTQYGTTAKQQFCRSVSRIFLSLLHGTLNFGILDVTHNMLRTHEENRSSQRKKIRFVSALDQIKCLEQIKYPRLLLTCAPISELPSNKRTITGHKLGPGIPVNIPQDLDP